MDRIYDYQLTLTNGKVIRVAAMPSLTWEEANDIMTNCGEETENTVAELREIWNRKATPEEVQEFSHGMFIYLDSQGRHEWLDGGRV